MFKEPITIKSASAEKPAIVIDDRGLSDALRQASENALTKSAKNAFCDDLIAAIEDAKVDAQGALNLSMPLKIEFRDEATKQAFMGLGRRNKLKKVAASIASLGRANLLDAMAQKLAMCAKKKGKKRGYGKKKRGVK
jgi:hypothetical protein